MMGDRRFWLAAFVIWGMTLWWLSSAPRHFYTPEEFLSIDKVYHFGYFFGGAGLLAPACLLTWPRLTPAKRWGLVVVILFACGVLDEFHQSFVKGRSGNDPYDLGADLLGAVAGAIVFEKLGVRFFRKHAPVSAT